MIAIKDIKMPSCCYACQLFKFSFCNEPYCVVEIRPVDLSKFDRPDWCPLVEVKDDSN